MMVVNANQAVNEWIIKYSDDFFNYIQSRVIDKSAASDILQETFIAAWKNSSSFKEDANEKTWLFSILKNKLVDHYRMQAKLKTVMPDNNYFFDDAEHWTKKAAPNKWSDGPGSLNNKEFYAVLEHCKSKLTGVQQLAFIMKYIDEYEAGFICKVCKLPRLIIGLLFTVASCNCEAVLKKTGF